MEYSPFDHDIHVITIETLFNTGDFDAGIEALNHAIKIDKEFGAYWETIGDSLQDSKQHQDAITAYEQCFMCLPNNINLLKKIGDCYMATEQLESAKAAYQQFKLEMEKLNGEIQ